MREGCGEATDRRRVAKPTWGKRRGWWQAGERKGGEGDGDWVEGGSELQVPHFWARR